jgi:FkbM family methyltransferase
MGKKMNLFFTLRDSKFGAWAYRVVRTLLPPLKIRRNVWGLKVVFDLRDCLFYLAMSRKQLETLEGPVLKIMEETDGAVWDVGCNVGLFSIYCASRARSVTSFDISDKCIGLLRTSAAINHLDIQTVPTALSIEPFEYVAPETAHTMNAVSGEGNTGKTKQSMTLDEAAERFGIPRLIKMDIEGGELEFFKSDVFCQWIKEHRVALLVEMHSEEIWQAAWTDLPHKKIDERHIYYFFD